MKKLLTFCIVAWLSTTSILWADALTPNASFPTDDNVMSIALLRPHGIDPPILAIGYGDRGMSIYTTAGEKIWSSRRPVYVVAPVKNSFKVYDDSGETSLTEVFIGHGGRQIMHGKVHSPSPVAPTTLERTSLSALGPIRIDGNRLVAGDRSVALEHEVFAVAALKDDSSNGLVAAASASGRVYLYDLAPIKKQLFE